MLVPEQQKGGAALLCVRSAFTILSNTETKKWLKQAATSDCWMVNTGRIISFPCRCFSGLCDVKWSSTSERGAPRSLCKHHFLRSSRLWEIQRLSKPHLQKRKKDNYGRNSISWSLVKWLICSISIEGNAAVTLKYDWASDMLSGDYYFIS